jgi:hypothetical protein
MAALRGEISFSYLKPFFLVIIIIIAKRLVLILNKLTMLLNYID